MTNYELAQRSRPTQVLQVWSTSHLQNLKKVNQNELQDWPLNTHTRWCQDSFSWKPLPIKPIQKQKRFATHKWFTSYSNHHCLTKPSSSSQLWNTSTTINQTSAWSTRPHSKPKQTEQWFVTFLLKIAWNKLIYLRQIISNTLNKRTCCMKTPWI